MFVQLKNCACLAQSTLGVVHAARKLHVLISNMSGEPQDLNYKNLPVNRSSAYYRHSSMCDCNGWCKNTKESVANEYVKQSTPEQFV